MVQNEVPKAVNTSKEGNKTKKTSSESTGSTHAPQGADMHLKLITKKAAPSDGYLLNKRS